MSLFTALALALAAVAPAAPAAAPPDRVRFVVGQDAASVDAYLASPCLPRPDGVTTYLGFYDLLSPAKRFGGAGIDAAGRPATGADWGAGTLNAWKSGRLPGIELLAIGLDITETGHPGGLAAIARGDHDREIAQLARLIRALPVTVALRIGYEFDGAWNKGYEDAARYKAAFRRIADGVRAGGAKNVRFVWQGSAAPVDDVIEGGRRETVADWYPGDPYVDWVGLSWFIPPDDRPATDAARRARPPTARVLADELVALARARGKRVMIAESAPQGFDLARGARRATSPLWDGVAGSPRGRLSSAEIWNAWFAPYFAFIRANADVIAAAAYIDANWDAQPMWAAPYPNGYWGDTRVGADAEIARRWRAALAGPPFDIARVNAPGACKGGERPAPVPDQ